MNDDQCNENQRRGKDEMNLAVLPIARLGRNDRRTRIEYYGTFKEPGQDQEKQVWIVEGAVGLPSEFAERVMVALLYIGAEQGFADQKMIFSVYRVLKVMGIAISNRNYRLVEAALKQLAGVLITSDKAWIERTEDAKLKRVTTARGFHLIDEYYLHYQEGDEEGNKSFIIWGSRLWKSIQSGYLKLLDVDFYFQIENPIARRLYRFLDKVMAYEVGQFYQIDIFDLANKLGIAPYDYAAHLRRPLKIAAQELVDRGYLGNFEFIKVGQFCRMRFYKQAQAVIEHLHLLDSESAYNKGTSNMITVPEGMTAPVTGAAKEEEGMLFTKEEEKYQIAWRNLLQELQQQLPGTTYSTWVRGTQLTAVIHEEKRVVLMLALPNTYARDWVENRLRFKIERVLRSMLAEPIAVSFQVSK